MTNNRTNQITAAQRKKEFYGVEGMVHVEHAEPGQFPGYIPTEKANTIEENLTVSMTEKIKYRIKQGRGKIIEALTKRK